MNREKLRRFYERKRQARSPNHSIENDTSGYESEQPSTSQEDRGRLRVRLGFQNNRRNGPVHRWKRELSEARSLIRELRAERDTWKKRCRSSQRSVQRYRNKETNNLTPRKETEKIMHEAKLTRIQKEKIRRPLLLGNVLVKEVRETKEQTPRGTMAAVHRIVSGRIVKKYRCAKLLASRTGLCRHKLGKCETKSYQIKKATRRGIVFPYQREIEEFMKREDNSRMQPGKADAKRIAKGKKIQTYVLSDYLSNLFQKYRSENPTAKISFASFCRTRPKHVLCAAFSTRSSCLCTRHQNTALTIKALKKAGLEIQGNPEKVLQNMPTVDEMKEHLGDTIVISQWKRVEVEEKGKKKYVTKIIETPLDQEQFLLHFENQMKDFKEHVYRVRSQY